MSISFREFFALSEIHNPTSKWPKELAGESLPTRKWIGILGGIEGWKDLQQIEIPENIENDALWRTKPVCAWGINISVLLGRDCIEN